MDFAWQKYPLWHGGTQTSNLASSTRIIQSLGHYARIIIAPVLLKNAQNCLSSILLYTHLAALLQSLFAHSGLLSQGFLSGSVGP